MLPPAPFPGLDSLGNNATSSTTAASSGMTPLQMLNNLLAAHPELASTLSAPPVTETGTFALAPAPGPIEAASSPASIATHSPATNAQQPQHAQQGSSNTGTWTPQATPGSAAWRKEMVERDFSTFPNPDKMYFTEEDAKKECPGFGKTFVTRDENGNVLTKQQTDAIERSVRFHCDLMLRVPEDEQDFKGDDYRKFSWWRENHITTLIKIANAIELDHPELAWGRHHYKTFKWIEKHGKWLKSKKTRALKNDGDQALPASSQASSSKVRKTNATAPTRQTSSHTSTSSNKKRKAHDTAPELQICHDPVQDTKTKTSQTRLSSGSALGSDLGTTPQPPLSRSTSSSFPTKHTSALGLVLATQHTAVLPLSHSHPSNLPQQLSSSSQPLGYSNSLKYTPVLSCLYLESPKRLYYHEPDSRGQERGSEG